MIIDESMIGAPVVDRDGHQIGTVKEIEESAFKVDAPLAFDYWLHFDGVLSASIDGVVMSVDSDHLDEFKLDSPEDAIPHGMRPGIDDHSTHERYDVEAGSDSYGAHDGTMVGEIITGQPPEDKVIVRAPMVGSGVLRNDDIAPAVVTDRGDFYPQLRKDLQSEHRTRGTREELEPGYQFGYEMAHDPRFHGRLWEDVEPELRTEWITWSGRSGAMSDDTSWDRARTSVRHAWDSARGNRRAA